MSNEIKDIPSEVEVTLEDVSVCLLNLRDNYTPMTFLRPTGSVMNMAWHLQCFLYHVLGDERCETLHVVLTPEDVRNASRLSNLLTLSYIQDGIKPDLIGTVCFEFVKKLETLDEAEVVKGLHRVIFSRPRKDVLFGFNPQSNRFYYVGSPDETFKGV